MRSLKIAGLCFAAMLVTGMSLATSAFAGPPLWLLCLNRGAGNGEFEGSNCISPAGRKEWASEGVTKSDTIKIRSFSIRLEDANAGPLNQKSVVKCNGTGSEGEGLLTTEKLAIINEVKVNNAKENCERLEGPCNTGEIEKMEGVNLPWEQIIVETEINMVRKTLGELRPDNGKTGEEGEPGWAVTCKVLGTSTTDRCVTVQFEGGGKKFESFELNNEITSGILLVRGVFEDRARGNCKVGNEAVKKGVAFCSGLVAILLPSGAGLSINLEK